ncbi:MAG: glycoside hydrolase family 88 protein [Roseburia sp.]
MDGNLFFDQFLKERKNTKVATFLEGCRQMYEVSGQEIFADFIVKNITEKVDKENTIRSDKAEKYLFDSIDTGKQLFFVYERTGEEKYREAIAGLIEELKKLRRTKSGIFSQESGSPDIFKISDFYQILPFYMEYETKYHNKAEYNEIVAQFQKIRKYCYNEEKGLYYQAYDEAKEQPWCNNETGLSQEFSMRSMGWYLMALIDVIGTMSEEIYEHYRTLGDLFKELVKGILPYKDAEPGMFGYAICKASRIGILNKEKYAGEGIKLIELFCKQMDDISSDEDMGICMMAYAQRQMLKKEWEKEVHHLG